MEATDRVLGWRLHVTVEHSNRKQEVSVLGEPKEQVKDTSLSHET